MKAVILAAGKGERLGEVSAALPKPLVPVDGKPILFHLVDLCAHQGVDQIYVNLHHLGDAIEAALGDGSRFGVPIRYKRESELLGTAGAVKNFEAELRGAPFFVLYGDNLMDYDLRDMLDAHRRANAEMTLAVFDLPDTRISGAVELDETGRVTGFFEKRPASEPTPGLVNAGLYVMEPSLLSAIPAGPCDFGRDVIPAFLKAGRRIHAVKMDHPVKAIDTPELYRRWVRPQP